jgi:PAS domain S-box-containing protein
MLSVSSDKQPKPNTPANLFGRRTLTRDITLVIVVAVILVSAISLAANLFISSRESEQQLTQKADDYISFLIKSLEIPLWNFDFPAIANLGHMMMSNDTISSLVIRDHTGDIQFTDSKTSSAESVVHKASVEYNGRIVGEFEIGLSKAQFELQRKRILTIGLITILSVIPIIFAVVVFSVRQLLRKPLDGFALGIEAIARGEYPDEPQVPAHIELRRIVQRFNQMAEKIKKREETLVKTNRTLRIEIREREKAEALLRESEQRFRSLNDNLPVGVFRNTIDGKIVNINLAMIQMLGLSADMVDSGYNAINFYVVAEDRERLLSEILDGKPVTNFESEWKRTDGKVFWVSISARGIEDKTGKIRYLDGIVEDISEHKKMEEEKAKLQNQLLQLQKMEAIGTLAGGIAHDFNNILGGILGYSELALELVKSERNNVPKYIRRILEAATRARDLVSQILNFSRHGTSEQVVLEMEPLVVECVNLLGSVLPKTITIKTELNATNDSVFADPTQIHQVIMNLGTNAYHAMQEDGGCMTFALDNVHVRQPRHVSGNIIMPGHYVKLSISDTGEGIPNHIRNRIFDPYFTTKAVDKGTGLGLSVTLGIVKNHNGILDVETSSGVGTTFSVFLPVSEDRLPPPWEERRMLQKGEDEHIVVVDDEPFFLDVMCEYLTRLNYRVTAFQNSTKALEAIRREPTAYDVLITDQTMPEITGVQLAGEVRKLNPHLPIILCTGYSETVDQFSAGGYGVSKFLLKPLSHRDLSQAVREVLQHTET